MGGARDMLLLLLLHSSTLLHNPPFSSWVVRMYVGIEDGARQDGG